MRPSNTDIYRQVAALHAQGLNRGFLARLGPRFLELLYETIDSDSTFHLITDLNNKKKLKGYVTGGPGIGPVYDGLVRKTPQLILALFPHILDTKNLRGILDLSIYRKSPRVNYSTSTSLPKHELLSIVVAPSERGTGLAERLYRQLEDSLRADGADSFKIVVGEELAPAHSFYKRMGAEPVATTSVHGKARSTIYVQEL